MPKDESTQGQALIAIGEILEALEDDERALRVIAAVAVLYGYRVVPDHGRYSGDDDAEG